MGITKITKTELLELTSTTGAVRLPSGTTAERPSTNINAGDFRYNTDENKVEYYDGSNWFQIDDESLPAVPSENFNIVLYNGNDASQAITGVGFQPDFVWIKRRSSSESHALYDSVRGINKQLESNSDAQEATNSAPYEGFTSFDSDCFTVINNGATNRVPNTYVGWCFKGGGNSNTFNIDGTGYGTASAASLDGGQATPTGASINTEGGLGIYKVSTSTAARTMTHGLPSTPQMYIFKATTKTQNWYVSVYDGANWKFGNLNTQSSFNTTTTYIADSSNVVIGAGGSTTEVVYAMCDIPGFQKIGTYTGNNTGGRQNQHIETGFEPAWLMIRNISSSSNNWIIVDNKRSPKNLRDRVIEPNTGDAEAEQTVNVNFLTNGFELTNGNSDVNDNGATYIYWSIAADPDTTTPTLANSFKTNLYTGTGGAQLTIGGHLNGAAQFNGSTSRIKLPSGAPFGDNNTIKCISGWFSLSGDTNTTDHPCWLYSVSTSVSPIAWFLVTVWTGSYNYVAVTRRQSTGNEGTAKGYYTPGTLLEGWHHVAVQLGSTEIEIYLDGRKLYTENNNSGNATNTSWIDYGNYSGTVVSQIGKSRENTSKYFKGSIDQVRFFNAALTSSQITELYNETTATANTLDFPTGAGCIAAYPLDTNSNDLSTNNYNGLDTDITYSDGPGFDAGLVWIKPRTDADNHLLTDQLRGVDATLYSNSTSAERLGPLAGNSSASTSGITAFVKNGFKIGSWNNINQSTILYVSWSWKGANNIGTINTTGSISAINFANANAGFSIVKYTGNGGSSQSVGTGLNNAPELVIFKRYDSIVNWFVFAKIGSVYKRFEGLNTDSDAGSVSSFGATSTTVTWSGTTSDFNGNGNLYIMYCFHSVPGYSKIGTYIGNNTTSRTVYTTDDGTSGGANGFEPGWLLIKRVDDTANWRILDNTRSTSNPRDKELYPNLPNIEGTFSAVNFNSNSFEIITTDPSYNALNGEYLYLVIK